MPTLSTTAATSVLLALTAALAPLTAAATAPDRAAAEGTSKVKVKDARGDGPSKAFDVTWVKASQTTKKVVLKIKVANLTAANTKAVKTDGGWTQPTGVSVLVAFDGEKDQYFNFTRSPGKSTTQGAAFHRYGDGAIDCNGDKKGYGISYAADVDTDVATLSFPIDCLLTPLSIAVSGRSYDYRSDGYSTDTVARKKGSEKVRWSSAMKVE